MLFRLSYCCTRCGSHVNLTGGEGRKKSQTHGKAGMSGLDSGGRNLKITEA